MTIYDIISARLPAIYSDSIEYGLNTFCMPQLVKVYNDGKPKVNISSQERVFELSFTHIEDTYRTTVEMIGYRIFHPLQVELCQHFTKFEGGIVGQMNQRLDWESVLTARQMLADAGVPSPYNLVVADYDYAFGLMTSIERQLVVMKIKENMPPGYRGSVDGIDIYSTTNSIPGFYAGLFNAHAIALDIQRAIHIELKNDEMLRQTKMIVRSEYGTALIRPQWGVTIHARARH